MTCTAASGTCPTCRSACERKPGWFLPGEAERTADFLGVSLAELFRHRLSVDYWYGDDRLSPTTFVLTPAMGDKAPGAVLSLDHNGRCTFYRDDGRCEIHEVKPFECAQWYCEVGEVEHAHVDVARAWAGHQGQIAELLGAEPELPPVTVFDLLEFTFGLLDQIDPPLPP